MRQEKDGWRQEDYRRAYLFAAQAHNGQPLPDSELPYIVHPTLVCMEVVAALEVEPDHDGRLAVQCALLHDVLEDTDVTYAQIKETFGGQVADGVLALSKDPAIEKTLRMNESLRRIRQQPREVWMVKLADRWDNLRTPPSTWTVEKIQSYRQEAEKIVATLGEASPYLAGRLRERIEGYGGG